VTPRRGGSEGRPHPDGSAVQPGFRSTPGRRAGGEPPTRDRSLCFLCGSRSLPGRPYCKLCHDAICALLCRGLIQDALTGVAK